MKYKYAYTKDAEHKEWVVYHQYDGVVIYSTKSKLRAQNKVKSLNRKKPRKK